MGDHVELQKQPLVDPKTIDYLTTHSGGDREFHLGRYKQSGVDWYSDPAGKQPVAPLKIPKPVTPTAKKAPTAEPLIKVVSR
jgi:hypothetical protein